MTTIEPPLSTRPMRACRIQRAAHLAGLPTPPSTPPLRSTRRPQPQRARSTPAQPVSNLPRTQDGLASASLPVTRAITPGSRLEVVITQSSRPASPADDNVEAQTALPRRGSALGLDLEDSDETTPSLTTTQLMTPDTVPDLPSSSASASKAQGSPKRQTIDGQPRCRVVRGFSCDFPGCDKAYFKKSRLEEHQLTHTGERKHKCEEDDCGKTYYRRSHLVAHKRTHKKAEEKPFVCPRDGCGKRFWTATHCKRHEESHDRAESHACEHCEAVFAKANQLRDHVADAHMPAGTKPWLCKHEGCGKSFAMKQQLKTHTKTHDPTRYMCTHPDHDPFPVFSNWTELRAHKREAHPSVCPYEECHGRTFKNDARLREHLKVHSEREEDLAAESEEDLAPVLSKRPRRKRRRSDVGESPVAVPKKLPRIHNGTAGKVFPCGDPGCSKVYKTAFARDEHSQAVHAKGRHRCDVCGRHYRRPASLKRHQAAGWCGDEPGPAEDSDLETTFAEDPEQDESQSDIAAELLGTATAPGGKQYRPWKCPYGAHVQLHRQEGVEVEEDCENEEGDGACSERFFRVYDVRRHLGAVHGVVIGDEETRKLLLLDGQRGD